MSRPEGPSHHSLRARTRRFPIVHGFAYEVGLTALAVVATLAVLAGCGGGGRASEPGGTRAPETGAATASATASESGSIAPTQTAPTASPPSSTGAPEPSDLGPAIALAGGTGRHVASIEADGTTRWFTYYVPASYVPGQGALLIALHGVNGGMENMWEERQDIVRLADRDGFVAVFPNGQNEQGNRGSSSWAGAWCCAYAFRLGRSDVEFVRLLIDAFERSLAVDPRRVYAMGFSNGAILAYELAARIPDRLAGVAAFAAAAAGIGGPGGTERATAPTAPVPLLMMHGTADRVAPFEGGESERFAGTVYISQAENVSLYSTAYGCAARPESSTEQGGKGAITVLRFSGCDADLVAVRLENVGHGWPDPSVAGFDGIGRAWEFLRAHVRP